MPQKKGVGKRLKWLDSLGYESFPKGIFHGRRSKRFSHACHWTCGFVTYIEFSDDVNMGIWLDSFVSGDASKKTLSYGYEFTDKKLFNKVVKALKINKSRKHSKSNLDQLGGGGDSECLKKPIAKGIHWDVSYKESFEEYQSYFITIYMDGINPDINGSVEKLSARIRDYMTKPC